MFTMGSGSSGTVWPGNAPSEIQGGGGASQSLARALRSKTGDILHPSVPQAFSGVDRGRLAPNLANTHNTHVSSHTSSSPSQAPSPKWTETTPRLEVSLSRAAGVQYFMPWIPVEPEQPFQFGTPMSVFLEQMHVRTRLSNGRIGLLVDPGAFDNLAGSHWLLLLSMMCRQYGLMGEWYLLNKVLGVEGVGKQAQEVTHGVRVPIFLDACEDLTSYSAPIVQDSYIPGLLGLRSLEEKDSVLDMRVSERKLYCGPVKIVPLAGCVVHQLETAASGHLLLPCDNFNNRYSAASKSKKPAEAFHSTFK